MPGGGENMKKIILATGNLHKLQEMQDILRPQGLDIISQKLFFNEEAVEDGLSFIENAIIKARFASKKTGLPAIADDSGLEVKSLNKQPGIYSARYSEGYLNQTATDDLNNQKLLAELEKSTSTDRTACYYCAMVYVEHAEDPTPIIGLGKWCGKVLHEEIGKGGFGYDPLMWFDSHQCTAAEMSKIKKNKISHRAIAMQNLLKSLTQANK